MDVLRNVDDLPRDLVFSVTVGMFDGVHRGHERVLRTAVAAAREHGGRAVVLTFDPHPDAVFGKGVPSLLCDAREKLERFAALGVGLTVVCGFDRQFADQSPDDFINRLASGRRLTALVMTPETAFGRGRSGTLAAIEALAPKIGFRVVTVPEAVVGAERVSSTRIRRELEAGRLGRVRRLLGRDYAVVGTVVSGDARGRQLGYPTANLDVARDVALPADGIYAVRLSWGGSTLLEPEMRADGVASLGVRPTFGGGRRTLEAYLFDFDGDLYGRQMRLEFVRRQRGERRFSSADALVAQMERDAARARQILGARSGEASYSSGASSGRPRSMRNAAR